MHTMKSRTIPLRTLIISLCIVGMFLEISGLIWSSKKDKPSETFLKLTEPVPHVIDNPLENGYFLLMGFAAASGADPVQVGYDIWLEADGRSLPQEFDFEKPGRSELRVPVDIDDVLPEWKASNPLEEFQREGAPFRTSAARYRILLQRYDQWLRMRFEDWGYAHTGAPRVEELMSTHRLYLADGFAQQSRLGLERLTRDVTHWRMVLREARTLSMKVLAEVMLEDDVEFLSRLISQPTVDRTLLTQALHLLQPLTRSEYSLRWPVQSEFMLGYRREQRFDRTLLPQERRDAAATASLARAARLQPDVFRTVEHPRTRRFFGMSSASQRTWDTYATFYDATIKAADSVHSPLPKLRDVARNAPLTLLERMANPLEFDPNWEPFAQRLVETDARLRLASLQILLRNPAATATIPTRLAEVGSMYFDPFTGFPMLWSPTQKRLYSVGKDGLDDGGDPTFDISVPLTPAMDPSLAVAKRAAR
jgi:hypothetical protein